MRPHRLARRPYANDTLAVDPWQLSRRMPAAARAWRRLRLLIAPNLPCARRSRGPLARSCANPKPSSREAMPAPVRLGIARARYSIYRRMGIRQQRHFAAERAGMVCGLGLHALNRGCGIRLAAAKYRRFYNTKPFFPVAGVCPEPATGISFQPGQARCGTYPGSRVLARPQPPSEN